jgi:uncharacterized protein YuzE
MGFLTFKGLFMSDNIIIKFNLKGKIMGLEYFT